MDPITRKALSRASLLTISLGLTLGVLEIASRIFYPAAVSFPPPQHVFDVKRGPIPFPNERGVMTAAGLSYSYSNNSLGLRGSVEYGEKTKPRILVLGDSFTWGVGVEDDQTFSSALQKLRPEYEIINAGNPYTGTDYALKFYRDIGRAWKPDIVVLCFFHNDFSDNQRHWFFDDRLSSVPLPSAVIAPPRWPVISWAVEHSRLLSLVRRITHPPNPSLHPEVTERLLSQLRDDVKNDHADFRVFYIPEKDCLDGSAQEDALTEIARRLELPLVSFRSRLNTSHYLKDRHWTANGHAIAAEVISQSLVR